MKEKDAEPRNKEKGAVSEETLVRILDKDIRGNKKVYIGMRRIKGISWATANAICKILKIDREKKIVDLSKEEISRIESFMKNPKLPTFLVNRRKDRESGEDTHLVSSDLELTKDFDIKLLKKIRSYRGLRHALGLPTRGQRTKSHFRANKKSRVIVGVSKKRGGK